MHIRATIDRSCNMVTLKIGRTNINTAPNIKPRLRYTDTSLTMAIADNTSAGQTAGIDKIITSKRMYTWLTFGFPRDSLA